MENNIIEKHEEDISPKVVNMFEKVRGKIISLRIVKSYLILI